MSGLPTLSDALLEGDEQLSAAVEADIEVNTARLLKDFPLASLTPVIDGLHHFPPPRAVSVRSWPVAAAPRPLPVDVQEVSEVFGQLDVPLDSLPPAKRRCIEDRLERTYAILNETLLSQPVNTLRFKDVPREVAASAAPIEPPSDGIKTGLNQIMDDLDLPRPAPTSGRSVCGHPVAPTAKQILESYITRALPAPLTNGHTLRMNGAVFSPSPRIERTSSNVQGSPRSHNEIYSPSSPLRYMERASKAPSQPAQVDVDQEELSEQASPSQVATKVPAQTPVQKLQSMLEDVFDAEDSFSMETENLHPTLHAALFTHLLKLTQQVLKGGSLLSVDIDSLTRLLRVLERGMRRAEDVEAIPTQMKIRSQVIVSTPTKPRSKAPTPAHTPVKRPVRKRRAAAKSSSPVFSGDSDENEDEEEDPNDLEDFKPGSASQSSRTSKRSGRASVSRSPSLSQSVKFEADPEEEDQMITWSDFALDGFEEALSKISEGLSCSELILTILSGAKLPKHLYSEELISSIISILKAQLDTLIYPCIEASADIEEGRASRLAEPLRAGSTKALFSDVFRAVAVLLPLVKDLLHQEDLPEAIVLPAVSIAMGPFFVDSPIQWEDKKKGKAKELFGATTLKIIQLPALSLLRNIFAKYPDQRSWIIEEIVNSLTKISDLKKARRQFRLRNGAVIHSISALLLHLIQSTAHGVEDSVKRQLNRQIEAEDEIANENPKDSAQIAGICRAPVKAAIESANLATNMLIKLLLERSKTSTKSSFDGDYKAAFDNLVADLVTVLDLPEWPVAGFLLQNCLRRMLAAMDAKLTSPESIALKTSAIEHLGIIGAKLCERRALYAAESLAPLQPLGRIIRSGNLAELESLIEAQSSLRSNLQHWFTEDAISETAAQFICTRWAADLLRAIDKINAEADDPSDDREDIIITESHLDQLLPRLQETLSAVFSEPKSSGMTDSLEKVDSAISMENIASRLAWAQGQGETFEILLNRILDTLHGSEAAGQRSKALRALGKVVEKDPTLFSRDDVRDAIEQRLRDAQASVRDGAFDLLGTYIMEDADLAAKYMPRIADRITDAGLSVRKRVIKLLRSIYPLMSSEQQQTEICKRLISRVKDDDEGIKALAIASVEELWFSHTGLASPRKHSSAKPSSKTRGSVMKDEEDDFSPSVQKYALLRQSKVLIALAGSMRDRGSHMEEALKLILTKYGDVPVMLSAMHTRFREMVDALVDVLIGPSSDHDDLVRQLPLFGHIKLKYMQNKVSCAKALDIFCAADASALSNSRADALLPFLQISATASPEDLAVREHLLRVLHNCLPAMPSTASVLAIKLESILLEMLKRPPMQQTSLVELVGALCKAVKYHTHAYDRLAGAFKRFWDTARASAAHALAIANPDMRTITTVNLLARVVALLCEHADFDTLRETSTQGKASVDGIMTSPVNRAVFDWLMSLYLQTSIPDLRSNAMLCLGFVFRAYPSMMLEPAATTIMDDVFSRVPGDIEEQARLLGVIHDFLQRQAGKSTSIKGAHSGLQRSQQSPVELTELIGNHTHVAESAASTALVQRYLSYILRAALELDARLKTPAIDILGFIVRQGMTHPLETLRVVVALETGPDAAIVKRMLALHSTLHIKHAEMIHTRNSDCARASFDYLSKLSVREEVRGYRSTGSDATAVFDSWYGLLKDKRKWKLDFVKAILRAFAVNRGAGAASQSDVDYARFAAENLASLAYKTQEEVFTCIAGLDTLLGNTGAQISHSLDERLDAADDDSMDDDGESAAPRRRATETTFGALVRASQILSIALMLRDHLKILYKITDARMSKHVPGKKSTIGDKAVLAQGGVSKRLQYHDLPLAIKALDDGSPEMAEQARQFCEKLGNDASTRDPDDDEDDA